MAVVIFLNPSEYPGFRPYLLSHREMDWQLMVEHEFGLCNKASYDSYVGLQYVFCVKLGSVGWML